MRALSVVLLLTPPVLAAQTAGPDTPGSVALATGRIRIDGRLDDAAWTGAEEVLLNFETSPRSNAPAPVRTSCRLARDADNLYLGCTAFDPRPREIRAQYVDRDGVQSHDRIALYLDTFDDSQRAFVFEVSAAGVQADAVFDQTRGVTDYSWNTVWWAAGRLSDEGYTVEASIPFRSLRFPPGSGRHWRFFLQRMWPRTEDVVLRSARRNERDACVLCDSDRLAAPDGIQRGANVQVTPTVTAGRTDRRSDAAAAGLTAGPVDPDVGADLRWGVTSEVAVAVTVNPDFSQVEADAVQLQANRRFALFVPERRDFFLQDAELFTTPIRAVFTRSIADPVAGAKLTGRSGRLAGGILYARDAVTSLVFPGAFRSGTSSLDQSAHVLVARGSRSVGGGSRVGAVLTHRAGEGYHNSVAGVDAFLRLAPPVEVQLQVLRSDTDYPAAVAAEFDQRDESFGGQAVRLDARYVTRDWNVRTRLESLGTGFRADAGFVTEVDTRRAELSMVRRFWGGDAAWLTRFDAAAGTWHIETQAGQLKEQGVWTSVQYQGPWQSTIGINPFINTEHYLGADYPRWGLNLSGSLRPNAAVGVNLGTSFGRAVDYLNARLANNRDLDLGADFRVGRRLSVDLTGSESRLTLAGATIVRERIAKVVAGYGFSERALLRALWQLRETRRDPALHRIPVDAYALRLESQLILSYRLNGQTAGYLGYSALAGGTRPEDVPLQVARQQQTFFLKLAYAWRP